MVESQKVKELMVFGYTQRATVLHIASRGCQWNGQPLSLCGIALRSTHVGINGGDAALCESCNEPDALTVARRTTGADGARFAADPTGPTTLHPDDVDDELEPMRFRSDFGDMDPNR